jgi:formyl-CoA transferase
MTDDNYRGPLAGVRVLDLGTMIAGPMASTLLADFGADVLKIELPGAGDPMRDIGNRVDGVNLAWLIAGRNKRSISLDIRKSAGREILLKLVAQADVLVENFRPKTLDRWGLDEQTLRAAGPGIVILRISGYGQEGPYSDRAGFDGIALAYGGVSYITGYPESPPSRCGVPVADYSTAYNGALSVMIALYHREVNGGEGQTIDLSLFETVFGMTRELLTEYELTGRVRERHGNSNPQIAPGGCYQTSDGAWIMVAGSNDNTWQRLATAIGRADLAADERYRSNSGRIANQPYLDGIIKNWIAAHSAEEAFATFLDNGVPATRMYSMADIAADQHYRERAALIEMEHEALGRIRIPGVPARLSQTPGVVRHLGPAVGAHNWDIYHDELKLSAAEIERLRSSGVI